MKPAGFFHYIWFMRYILPLLFLLYSGLTNGQTYTVYKTNWKDAGYKGIKPTFTQSVNILNHGGNNTGSGSNNTALQTAISALGGQPGIIYFPPGIYTFTGQVSINRDSLILKGAGYDSTFLKFNLNGILNNCINIYGTQLNADTSSFSQTGIRDSNSVNVLNPGLYQPGQWVYLQTTDNAYMASTWAYGSLGQIMQIKSKNGNRLTFNSPFRFNYRLPLYPKIKRLIPRHNIGIECLRIERLDATTNQTSLISFDRAVNCWIKGIEGDTTNYAHVEFNRSSNCEVTDSYFHHAFAYGGSGQAYGIALQYSSNEIRIENTIFRHLRHSVLLQAGANGNVIAYNYSYDPYWIQSLFPTNSAGDMVLHGNYPFSNLFEGNICQNIVIDNSHAKNGPYNTFFRNRAELYGIVMNNSPATDTVQFIGNECTNTSALMGNYTLYGNGHTQYGNMIKGNLTPAGTGSLTDNTLYLAPGQAPLCYVNGQYNWPVLGIPNPYNTGTNPAKNRFSQNKWALCTACSGATITTGIPHFNQTNNKLEVILFPNPVNGIILNIKCNKTVNTICLYDVNGRQVLQCSPDQRQINTEALSSGVYIIEFTRDDEVYRVRFCK